MLKKNVQVLEHPLAQSALPENRIGAIMHAHAHTCMHSHITHSIYTDTQTHTHTQRVVYFFTSILRANKNLCLLSDAFAYRQPLETMWVVISGKC